MLTGPSVDLIRCSSAVISQPLLLARPSPLVMLIFFLLLSVFSSAAPELTARRARGLHVSTSTSAY